MPLINVNPMIMQNGDVVTSYTNTVGTTQETFTFLKTQEKVRLKNNGNKNISYTIGGQSGTLGRSETVEITGTVDSLVLSSEQGTQQFSVWADEIGSVSVTPEAISSLTTQLAQKASQSDLNNSIAKSLNLIRNNSTSQPITLDNLVKAIKNKSVTVTFWGDSITEYSDALDDSQLYAVQYMNELKKAFPSVAFTYNNRAIRATTLENAADSTYIPTSDSLRPWTVGNANPWRDVVRDTTPDLLFIAFGMNPNTTKAFYQSWQDIMSYVATWTKQPTIVLITNPIPNILRYNQSGVNQRIENARATREFARSRGLYCIDAARNCRIAKDGVDELSFYGLAYKNFDPSYWTVDDASVTMTNSETTFTALNKYIRSKNLFYNFTLSAEADFSTGGYFRVDFRNNGNSIIIRSTGTINLYSAQGVEVKNVTVAGWVADYKKIYILVDGSKIQIYTDGVLRLEHAEFIYGMLPATVNICNTKSSTTLKVRNITLVDQKFSDTVIISNDDEIFGQYAGSDTSQKLPYGGNGVNHPSSIGTKLLYYNGIIELIKQVMSTMTLSPKFTIPFKKITNTDWLVPATPTYPTTNSSGVPLWYVALRNPIVVGNIFTREISSYAYYRRRQDITTTAGLANLLVNEFAIYNSGSTTLIFVAKDAKANIPDIEVLIESYEI